MLQRTAKKVVGPARLGALPLSEQAPRLFSPSSVASARLALSIVANEALACAGRRTCYVYATSISPRVTCRRKGHDTIGRKSLRGRVERAGHENFFRIAPFRSS